MQANLSASDPVETLDANWHAREAYWRRKLGRLRLGVEPIDEQLTRYRRVTWALTAVPGVLALMFFTLFAVFGYPIVGLVFDAIVLLPIVLGAWLDFGLMTRRARRYRDEAEHYLREKERLRPPPDH